MAYEIAISLRMKQPLCEDELLLCLALAEHRHEVDGYNAQLQALLSNPPYQGNDKESAKAQLKYRIELNKVQCACIRADCCHRLPLDHPYGEQLNPPDIEHWGTAPGVING